MLSRKLLPVIVLPLVLGCATAKKAVYVDISRVAAFDVSPVAASITEDPRKPVLLGSEVVYLPGLPAQRIDFPKVQKLLEQAQDEIERSQQQTYEDLRKNLLRVYSAKAGLEANEYRKNTTEKTDDLLQDALNKLEAAFQLYAAQRAEPLSRLAFLQTQDKRRPKISDEIAQLRELLDAQERQFDVEARALFAAVDAARDARLTKLEAEVQRILQRWREKAAQDAEGMTKTMTRRLNSTLAGLGSVQLPARSGSQVRIEGAPPVEPMPDVPAPDPNSQVEARIKHDLEIWLAINDARIGKKGDRDRTQEFIEWRRRHQVGR